MSETLIAQVRSALGKLARSNTLLQGHRLIERLRDQSGLTVIEIRRALGELRDAGELRCRDWLNNEPLGRLELALAMGTPTPSQIEWEAVLRSSGLSETDVVTLLPAHAVLEGIDIDDMHRIVQGLARLRDEQGSFIGASRFEVSARFLLGSSKLLDAIPASTLRSFGIAIDSFSKFPGYIVIAGPPVPVAVVLVENPHAFEAALRAPGTDDTAWLATFGFGLSIRSEEYGVQLVELLTNAQRVPYPLTRKGAPPPIEQLLTHPRLFFWGDLDPAGLQIFERLRRSYPALRLSRLYQPLLDIRASPECSHPYVFATGKAGQSAWRSDDPKLASLIKLCEFRGVDQEAVTEPDISALCREALEMG